MTQEATNTRRRWGCACGCLVVIGSILLALAILLIISLKSTPPVTREQMANPNTALYGEVRFNVEDKGVSEMLNSIVSVKAPELVSAIKSSEFAEKFIIPQGTILVDESDSGQWIAYGVIQPANAATRYFLRSLLQGIAKTDKKTKLRDDNGAQILSIDNGKWAAAIGKKTLVLGADNTRLAELANGVGVGKDLSTTQAAAAVFSPEMQKTIQQMDIERPAATEDATIIMGNRAGRIRSLLKWVEEEVDSPGLGQEMANDFAARAVNLDSIQWLRLGIDIQSADTTIFELSAACESPEQATIAADVLKQWIPKAVSKKLKLTITPEAGIRGNRAVVRTQVDGIKQYLPK